jgi:hypothetical protein
MLPDSCFGNLREGLKKSLPKIQKLYPEVVMVDIHSENGDLFFVVFEH